MEDNRERYDVCVIGGGPGGSTVASFVAMAGYRVLLLEKETVPIYKIGESLLPATIHGVCGMLGVSKQLESQNFVRKLGGTFRWGKNKAPWTFAFAESSRFQGPTSYAYQVERIKFDTILLDNAKRKGVEVRERHSVQDLVLEGGRVIGVKVKNQDGEARLMRSKYVVDASGHTSPVARYAGQRLFSRFFRNIAVFGYFNNGARLPPPNSGNIFCAAFDKGWCWYIPLSDDLTSVGAVIGQEYSDIFHKGNDHALNELIKGCEPISSLLCNAVRCKDGIYGEARVRKDYSYCHSKFWKPGLVLIGDAACFIDPIFSSGVHLATYSALLAARSINTCLSNGLSEKLAFEEFEARYRREYSCFYDFLTAFYDLEQDLQGYYWAARRLVNSEEAGNEAFLQLVGGDASDELLGGSRSTSSCDGGISGFMFPAARGASRDMYVESGHQSAARKRFSSKLNSEGFKLQLRGTYKSASREQPLFKNGLVPSLDGIHWIRPHT